MTIFIAIASYCDPVLRMTLASAYEKARFPDQLRFGIVDQSPKNASYPVPAHIPADQVSYVYVEAAQSRGCCWARSLVMSLYRDEDYYFQVDSHTLFAQDWDDILIRKLTACLQFSSKAVVSSYPPGFHFANELPIPDETPYKISEMLAAAVVSAGTVFQQKHPCFIFQTKKIMKIGAVQGYHISAGCLFAPGQFVQSVPYDPFLYFGEEEQSISLRLYTQGWDIYHVAGIPVYHLYNQVGAPARPLHWAVAEGATEKPKWWGQIRRAQKRIATLVWGDSSQLGVYGLGRQRSLQDYAEMCGIDYPGRTIAQKAFDGPWDVPPEQIIPRSTT